MAAPDPALEFSWSPNNNTQKIVKIADIFLLSGQDAFDLWQVQKQQCKQASWDFQLGCSAHDDDVAVRDPGHRDLNAAGVRQAKLEWRLTDPLGERKSLFHIPEEVNY